MQPDRFTVKSQEAVAAAQAAGGQTAQLRGRPRPPAARPGPAGRRAGGADPAQDRRRPGGGRDGRERGGRSAAEAERRRAARGASLLRLPRGAAGGRARDGQARRRVHLDRPHPAGDDRQGLGPRRAAARRDGAGEGDRRSPPAAGHHARAGDDGAGAGEIRPRPDRRGAERQARPGDRARRGDPPRDPGALAADQEQPGADRRPRRRQDGDRRGAGAADRQRRRAGEPARPARDRARHRLAARRLQIPRRVRGAAESGALRGPGGGGADRPLPRRAAHDRRRRRGRRRGRRRQPAEADAGAR